jgi:DNA-binding winged helix-turn-helix (wHTH) protein/tetratricopeptide (TPR) repeat protein
MPRKPAGVPNEGRKNAENPPTPPTPVVSAAEIFRFGDFTLSIPEGRLARAGRPVALAPKPFETLVYLVHHAGRVVPKQELLDQVWAETFVTDDVLVQAIGEVRRVLGDNPRDPRFVETVPRRGYSFVAPLERATPAGPASPDVPAMAPERARVHPFPRPVVATSPPPVRRWPSRSVAGTAVAAVVLALGALGWGLAGRWSPPAPALEAGTVAILPIHMVEPGEDREWLPTGLEQILASELGRRPGVQVVPRARMAAALAADGPAGQPLSTERALAAGRRVGAEYVVRANFQRAADRFMLRAELVSAASGRVAAEEAAEGTRADLLELVTNLCARLGRRLPGRGGTPDGRLAALPPTRSLDAFRAFSEALVLEAQGGRANLEAAEARLRHAVDLDPDFARAHLKLALVQEARVRWGYGPADPVPAVRAALERSGRLPERDQGVVAGLARLVIDRDPTAAIEQWTRVLQLYPSYAEEAGVPLLVAETLRRNGQWNELILTTAPYADAEGLPGPDRAMLNGLVASGFRRKGEYARAISFARRAVDLWPVKAGPGHLRVRTLLGRFLVDAGLRSEALEVFRQVAGDPLADVVNLTDAGWGFYMAGEAREAADLAEHALQVDAAYGNAYHLRGWLRLTSGDDHGASRDLAEAHRQTPSGFGSPEQGVIGGDVAALYYSGVARARLGDREGAEAAWRAVITEASGVLAAPVDPQNPLLRWQAASLVAIASARLGLAVTEPAPLAQDEALSRIQTARLYAVMGRLDEALAQLRQAISLGCGDFQHIADDPNFEALADRPEFTRLLATLLEGG